MPDFSNEINELFIEFSSNINGLSNEQAKLNQDKYGKNVLQQKKPLPFLMKFLLQFKNLMVIILLLSAIISFLLALTHHNYGDLFEGVLIFVIVVINSLIGAIQERKAENTLLLLQKKTSSKTNVKRNNSFVELDIEEIVPGDIVELKIGDIVPADIRLIETNNFSCDESSLTGESKKTNKNANWKTKNTALLSDKKNMCYKGTIVTSGNAIGIVVSTGKNTEIGKIAGLINTSKKQKTPLEKNIDKIGQVVTIGVCCIVVVVFFVQLVFSNKINFGDAFMTAIALAVAAIPESLPAVITIIMALGVQRLGEHNAIVKTLSSVETLGCCTCICSDKTGTITQNKMSISHIFTSSKLYSDKQTSNKNFETIFLISSLCNNVKTNENGQLVGDATEKALYSYCERHNYNIEQKRQEYKRTKEFPFDSSIKQMISINRTKTNIIACIKGAPEYLIDKCTHILQDGKVELLTAEQKDIIQKNLLIMTQSAERPLLLALKRLESPNDDTNFGYIFVAIVGIVDPPRPEVKNAIKKCKKAGLNIFMITGDNKETAFAIAKNVGITHNKNEVITGKDLSVISDDDLKKVIMNYRVFARVTSEHKSRIVKALKANGNIVAMTGDGVNDAPSIKDADIGTCMGQSGTDVTKSVSDLIITDDNFATIVTAVGEGRTIYNNIQKTLQFLISTNAVEVLGLFVVSVIMHDAIFLLPTQILFINLITDSLPAFALGVEPPEQNIMELPPRNPKQTIFSGEIGTAIIYQAFVQTLVVLVLFVYSYHTYSNNVATTMVFLVICLMQIIHAINCKTNKSLFKINVFSNKLFNVSFFILFGLIMLVGLVPAVSSVFGLVSLNFVQWLIVFACSISIVPLVELCKLTLHLIEKHKKNSQF